MLTHLVRHLWKANVLVIYYTRINYQLRFCNAHVFHLWSCSEAGLLAMEGEAVLPFCIPLSTGTATPHFPSDSKGSITLTDPSVIPTANWFGSCGCAVTTSGDRVWLLQSEKKKKNLGLNTNIDFKQWVVVSSDMSMLFTVANSRLLNV